MLSQRLNSCATKMFLRIAYDERARSVLRKYNLVILFTIYAQKKQHSSRPASQLIFLIIESPMMRTSMSSILFDRGQPFHSSFVIFLYDFLIWRKPARRLLLRKSQNVMRHYYYLLKRSLNELIEFRFWLRWLCIKREQLGESATNALADMHQQLSDYFKEQYK